MKRQADRAKAIVLSNVPVRGNVPEISDTNRLNSYAFSSFAIFEAWRNANHDLIASWQRDDVEATQDRQSYTMPGFCALCDQTVSFAVSTSLTSDDPAGGRMPNWRETLSCPQCRMSNRMRAALHLAIQEFGLASASRIYATEQIGPVYRWLRGHFSDVRGSEYVSSDKAPGSTRFGITHEDVQALTMADGSIDQILTFDVMEHVPDVPSAYSSLYRVLRPGGRLVMTAPFDLYSFNTSVRAVAMEDGTIRHLLPPEIHVNPFDPKNGSLCYRHFGWDTLDELKNSGFSEASVLVYHDRRFGYLGGLQSLVTATRT